VSELRFEWDERKNAESRRKHGVSFEEARAVFLDDHAMLIDDPTIRITKNGSSCSA
jgi:uncharacterized DUF497 family protein